MTITVEPFENGTQKPEIYHDWIEAKNAAQELANIHQKDFGLFGDDHDLEAVIRPKVTHYGLLLEVCKECQEAGGQIRGDLMHRIIEAVSA